MHKEIALIQEMIGLYGEWLEMAGGEAQTLLLLILSKKLLQERELNYCYKKRLDEKSMARQVNT